MSVDWSKHCAKCAAGDPTHRLVWQFGAMGALFAGLSRIGAKSTESMRGWAEAWRKAGATNTVPLDDELELPSSDENGFSG